MNNAFRFVIIAAALVSLMRAPALTQHKVRDADAQCAKAMLAAAPTFNTFPASAWPALAKMDLAPLRTTRKPIFGRSFSDRIALRDIIAALSIYGYDYVGTRQGYLLFYRRPVAWVQTTSIPRLTAPNGELLPAIDLPGDLDPRWPAPGLLARTPPFVGAIVLAQQIIAYPCNA